ncbi:MAG: hypothetical protein WCF92_00370 [bacterium]
METLTAKNSISEEEQKTSETEKNIDEKIPSETIDLEVKNFSKRYSSVGRKKLVDEILDIRSKFFEKEKSNPERSELIKTNEEELGLLHKELKQIEGEIHESQEQIAIRNSKLWSKIKDWIKKEELLEELKLEASQKKLIDVQNQIKERYNLISQTESVILDTSKLDEAKEKLKQFYVEQGKLKNMYEGEDQERDLASISKRDGIIFLHGLPTGERPMNETSENNEVISTRGLGTDTKLNLLIGLEPTISASAIREGDETSKTFYPFGVILNQGKVLSAYKEDAGTITEGVYSRRSKYDKQTQGTSIQQNSATKLQEAVDIDPAQRNWGSHNEISIEKPGIAALYINLSQADGYKPISITELKKYSEELNLPVFALYKGKLFPFNLNEKYITRENGRIVENADAFKIGDELGNKSVGLSSITENGRGITKEEKLECAKKAIEQFPFLIKSKDKKLVEAFLDGSNVDYSGKSGYEKFLNNVKVFKEQEAAGGAVFSNPGTLSDYLKQNKEDLMDWKKRIDGTHTETVGTKQNSRAARNYARQQFEQNIFGLYGFAKEAEEMGDTATAKEAFLIIEEFYPISKCDELLKKRVDEKGEFKILEEDIPLEVRKHIKELQA